MLLLLSACTLISDADMDEKLAPDSDSGVVAATDTSNSDSGGDTGSSDSAGDAGADSDGDGYSVAGGDCDDDDHAIHPGADEVCDGVDDDCGGLTDDNAIDVTLYFVDVDDDAYGDPSTGVQACTAPAGYVLDSTDCYDQSERLPGRG